MSRLDEATSYESAQTLAAQTMPGVSFTIRRISLARRNELIRQVRELSNQIEFLNAGHGVREQIEANFLGNEIELLYLRWGLIRVSGLRIDGEEATVDSLIDRGPEDLAQEIVAAVKKQIGLTEEERKN